jgi:hypothetical protein
LSTSTPKTGKLSILSGDITVYNNVETVEIVTQPLLFPAGYKAPISFSPKKGGQPRLFEQQPKVRVLDYNGNPMPHLTVIPAVFPAMGIVWNRNIVTDADGYYQFEGLTSLSGGAGDYSMVFFVAGVPSNTSDTFEKFAAAGVQKQFNNLKYALLLMYGILIPLFIANYPGNDYWWVPISLLSVVAIGLITYFWYLKDVLYNWSTASIWLQIAGIYLMTTFFLLCLTWIRVSSRFWRSRVMAEVLYRLWGIKKAQEQYDYAKWILSIRMDLQDRTEANMKTLARPTQIVHQPDKSLMKHAVPFRFYLAMGLSAWLISLFILLTVYIFLNLTDLVREIHDLFPSVRDLTDEEKALGNEEFQNALLLTVDNLVKINPSFSFLYRSVTLFRKIQVLDQILSVSDWAEALEKGMRIAGYISCVLCVLIACVVVFLLCNSVKGELLLVRKSKGMPVP